MAKFYSEFFDIDQNYFPQINDSSILQGEKDDPDFWMRTYPHKTFVEMLAHFEEVLSRKNKRTLWVEGAYGSGKSQCAYTMRRLLEVPEEKVNEYWNRYDSLSKRNDIRLKLLGHKKNKQIVTAFRYGSGDVIGSRQFFSMIQDSLITEFKRHGIKKIGSESWRQAAIAWLSDDTNKQVFNLYLRTKYSNAFAQKSADEVLRDLNKDEDVSVLMANLMNMGDAQGIEVFSFNDDRFLDWVREVFKENPNLCVVFIWDEFGDFFSNNPTCLTSFQRMIELVAEVPFYFIGVTHELSHILDRAGASKNQLKVLDRIVSSDIVLPDHTAFELIGAATTIKPATAKIWEKFSDGLNDRVTDSRKKVSQFASINDSHVIKRIMPIHPLTALVLKHIATAFKSNQRSMFDFIKTENSDVHAFQWYISSYGPTGDSPFLTIDLLWNFFYENGRNNLTKDILDILSGYNRLEKKLEDENEKRVLKTILILNALDRRNEGVVELFKASEEVLKLAFEGVTSLDGARACNIAKKLVNNGILIYDKVGKTQYYRTAVNESDGGVCPPIPLPSTSTLINEGNLQGLLSLPWKLKLRYEAGNGYVGVPVVGFENFTKTLSDLRTKDVASWEMKILVCVARTNEEANRFRTEISCACQNEDNKEIVIIDATSVPLPQEQINEYCEEGGYAKYYTSKDIKAAESHSDRMRKIIEKWGASIAAGTFTIYYRGKHEEVEKKEGVHNKLQGFVSERFGQVFDFTEGLTESMIKANQCTASAKCGAKRGIPGIINNPKEFSKLTSGSIVGIEKRLFPTKDGEPDIWKTDNYWQVYPTELISKIKTALDQYIKDAFEENGCISVPEIYDWLEEKHGFAKSNLYSFLTGYLLCDYANDSTLRYTDSNNAQEEMAPDKLAEAVGNYISGKQKLEFRIVKQSKEERHFYLLLQKTWGAKEKVTTPASAMAEIQTFLLRRALPLRFLESQISPETYGILSKFIDFCQKSGAQQMEILREIGTFVEKKPGLESSLSEALEEENFQNGTLAYLQQFDSGKLWALKEEIGADSILKDLKQKFSTVKYQFLWNEETQDDQIRLLETEYEFAALTGRILNLEVCTESKAYEAWRDTTKNLRVSHETIVKERPELSEFVGYWQTMLSSRILADQLPEVTKEMRAQSQTLFDLFYGVGDFEMFKKAFQPILNEDIPDDYIREIYDSQECQNMFGRSLAEGNKIVSQVWRNLSSKIWGTKLEKLWHERTNSKSPREWSRMSRTPILCLVPEEEFNKLSKALETVENWKNRNDDELKNVYEYLFDSSFFETLDDEEEWDKAFVRSFYKGNKLYLKFIPVETARDAFSRCVADPYEWYSNPMIATTMERLMNEAYQKQGKSLALDKVKEMSTSKLQEYVVRLIEEKPAVGMEILASEDD